MLSHTKPLLIAAFLSLFSAAKASDLIISGVIDGPRTGGVPKAIEVYAINNIADLSVYGLGSANNGGGSDGQEFTFPPLFVPAGSYIYVASESPQFTTYFGSPPDYTSSAASINGDDAIELFQNGAVVDVFGDINVDGTGQPWEHLDGWAYRKSGSSPSGSIFQLSEWNFSGPNAIDNCSTNAACVSVYPYKTFGDASPPEDPPTDPPAPSTITKIHDIQGTGPTVAITLEVTVEAVVTAIIESIGSTSPVGFFLQEEDADIDANDATSEGIYVYCGSNNAMCSPIQKGDLVQVTGNPSEFFGMSQIGISGGSVSVVSSGNVLPTATVVALPAAGSTEDEATFENVEGMLVTFSSTLVVSEYFQLSRFGEIVLTDSARAYQFTHDNSPSVSGLAAFEADLSTRTIILDDDNGDQNAPISNAPETAYPYPTDGGFPNGGLSLTNKFRGGDSIDNLTGVLHFTFGAWKVRPVRGIDYKFTSVNKAPATPGDVGGSFKVASFNVLNYFVTLGERGADSTEELDRQRAKIVAALQVLDADVVGLIEIENSPNDEATAHLLSGLNAVVGAGTYDFVTTGMIGSDAIKVAFIYKPATTALIGSFAVLDSAIDPLFVDTKNRPVLIQTFEQIATGGKLTVAVNHFKSKGSSCDGLGDLNLNDGQGNCAGTRANAATALAAFLATDPTGSGDADFMIIGDLNAYKKEDAITNLIGQGYTDLAERFEGNAAYGYLFDGKIGYLDYALANDALLPQVTGVKEWHINADEIPLFDYNDCVIDSFESSFERKSCANGDLFAPDALRSSDHDPVLIGLDLCSAANACGSSCCKLGETCGENDVCRIQSRSDGDPHFTTWKNEHFEFHGQCDIVLTSNREFANGLGLHIHLRTKMVRYWSYIEKAAVRIGNDILEVQGLPDFSLSYWLNYEHLGELTDLAGFPVTINTRRNKYSIDLDSAYPGQKIEIKTFKEFVGVKIIGATEDSFGNAVGINGDFKTGKTLARDGTTVLHDFNELGLEWQVLPSDGKLFHEMSLPQFPELCYLPEDPRGNRARRLSESIISEEAAEAVCATLKDALERKDCVYDILATQDMDMVGAY